MIEHLKGEKCPICNSNAIIIQHCEICWTIYCNSCGRNDAEVNGKTKEEVVEKWNNLCKK